MEVPALVHGTSILRRLHLFDLGTETRLNLEVYGQVNAKAADLMNRIP
jgi:hypothetical protein